MILRFIGIGIITCLTSGLMFGQLHHFNVELTGGGIIPGQTAGIPLFIQIVAQDSVNNTVSDFNGTVDITSTGTLSSGSGTTLPFTAGILDSHEVQFLNTGTFFITALHTDSTETGSSNLFSVEAGSPFSLVFVQQPTSTVAGNSITPPVTVRLRDSLGNNALTSGISVSLEVNSGTGTLIGTTTKPTDTLGIATFDDVTMSVSGLKTFSASGVGLSSDTSEEFSVLHASLDHFIVEDTGDGNIPTRFAGSSFFIKISAKDTFENTVTSFGGTADISSAGTLSMGNGTTGGFTGGILLSHELLFSNTGTFTITATETGGIASGTSNSFTVTSGPLDHFLVESSSGGIVPTQLAEQSFGIRIVAQDADNNSVTNFTGTVDISSTGVVSSGGGTTAAFTAGILSPHTITIASGGSFTITATETGGSITGTSNTFIVNNLAPSTTSIAPSTKTTGEPGFTLTINGTNFTTSTLVQFNGSARTTTFVNATQLTASVLSTDIDTAGIFPITAFTPAPGGGTSNIRQLTVNSPVVNAKVFLEGAFSGSSMGTALLSGNLIPLSQPYGPSPTNYSGSENVASIPPNVVDWVLLELRTGTGSSTRIARRAALLKNDGMIVDLDGINPVTFSSLSIGSYFVVIHHRNHLDIMSATAIALNQATALYDFTTGLARHFGNDAKALGGGRFGMYGGDYSSDGFMDASDFIGPDNDVFLSGYRQSDLNLDGFVDVSDFIFPDNNVFIGTNVPN